MSEYQVEKLMYEIARLFAEKIWLRREERSGDAPSEQTQLLKTECGTSIGK